MDKKDDNPMGEAIRTDGARIKDHPGEMVRDVVEEALNRLLDAEAGQLADAAKPDGNQPKRNQMKFEGIV